jgi:apolipoprotein D and lipocalin family protein
MTRTVRIAAAGLFLYSAAFILVPAGAAQSATAIPKLNPTQIIGTYYVIARLPIKRQKACLANELVLYALADKKRTVQIVTTCQVKNDNSDGWNSAGKFSQSGDGEIKLGWIWPFTSKYWILGLAPDATWVIAGTPNHKSLWILSGTPTLPADTLAQLKSTAAAQGYNTAKLVTIAQHPLLAGIAGNTAPVAAH